jgi:hypothetical protein
MWTGFAGQATRKIDPSRRKSGRMTILEEQQATDAGCGIMIDSLEIEI